MKIPSQSARHSSHCVASLALVSLFAVLAGCGEPPAPEPAVARVVLATVTSGPAIPVIETSGVVLTRDELQLSFKVAGIVRQITVREGDVVRKGQLLAALELDEVDAEVHQARELANKAERDRVRGEQLRADSLISAGDMERLRTEAEVTRARLKTAEFNRQYAVITAPRDGTVLRRQIEERQFVAAGQDVLLLGASRGGHVVRAGLADRELVSLRLGDRASVTIDALPGQQLPGRITEIPGAANPETGLFEIEVTLDSPPQRLVSGLLARLSITPAGATQSSLPYVPLAAIIEAQGEKAAVFVPEGGRAKRRELRVAFITTEAVAVADGLQAGEQVVTDGALYLDDGEPIEVASPRQ